MTVDILFEDNHLIVVNKKSGKLVQGDKTGDATLMDEIKAFIKERDNKPGNVFLGLIHRLDRPTSGIVIFAKTGKALKRMNETFKKREIEKKYWAITNPLPPEIEKEGTLIHYLAKNQRTNKVTVYQRPGNGAKKAVLHYKFLKNLDNYQLFEIALETGRSHQIRAQMSKIGATIKGDLKYGAARSNPGGNIHLHARYVKFTHPVAQHTVEILAPLPQDDTLWKACGM